jgi:hypothetical protein
MSSNFDAYHKWLSIPPSEQPPNHYRLLGLGLFESDPDVISAAGDRQMAHVKTYKNGPHAALSQELLNEIAAAKLCLLKPAKKEIYDEQLRRGFAGQRTAQLRAVLQGAATPAAIPNRASASSLPPPPFAVPPQLEDSNRELRRPAFGTTAIVAAGGAIVLLLVGAIAVAVSLRHGTQATNSGDPSSPTTRIAATTPTDAANSNGSSKTDVSATLPPSPAVTGGTGIPAIPRPTATGEHKTDVSRVSSPISPPTNPPLAAVTGAAEVKPPDSVGDSKAKQVNDPTKSNPPGNVAPKKWDVPDESAQTAAEKRFSEIFDGAAAPQLVLQKAKPLTDGPLVYVALNKALGAGISQGDVALVGQITDDLSRRFTVDEAPLRAKALFDLRSHIATTPGWESLASAALPLIDEAVAANQPALALSLAETALIAARKSGNLELVRKATLRVVTLQEQGSAGRESGTR